MTGADLAAARARIAPHLRHTPLVASPLLAARCGVERSGVELWLKLENAQHTGSFKPRGALNKILELGAAARQRGVVAASAGNHALGVAFAAAAVGGVSAELFVQANASPAKVGKLETYAAVQLHLVGETYEEAQEAALRHAEATGASYVSAYDDPAVVAGQGTVGLEILDDLPDVDTVLVPVGGGALSAGIAVAIKTARPRARVIGVNPEASPSALRSFERGAAIDPFAHDPTLAHGLAGGYGRVPFAIAHSLIDAILLVSEADLRAAMAALIDCDQVLAEPSGAAAVAAALRYGGELAGRTVAVVSGGNIDSATLGRVLRGS